MYRLVVESLLGLAREGNRLRFTPCLPADWNAFTMRYRYGEAIYVIEVGQVPSRSDATSEATSVTVDGLTQADGLVHLVDDRLEHRVVVTVIAGKT
jgi:cyclic beta-1,2-glucan synthetase